MTESHDMGLERNQRDLTSIAPSKPMELKENKGLNKSHLYG